MTIEEIVDCINNWESENAESFFDYFCNHCSNETVSAIFAFFKESEYKNDLEKIEAEDGKLYTLPQLEEIDGYYDDETVNRNVKELMAKFLILKPEEIDGFLKFIND